MKYLVICFLGLFFLLTPKHVGAQISQDMPLMIGGLLGEDKEKIKLDDAQLSAIYQFRHEVISNKKNIVIDTMVLVVGPQYSIYYDRNDKIRRKAFSSYFTHNGAPKVFLSAPYNKFTEIAVNDNYLFIPSLSGETSQLYKDRKKNVITIMDFDNTNFDTDELFFLYEEEISPITWEMREDTMSVLGYTCTKATCDLGGRHFIAWFTQEIPINDGPYKFYGLPGMILKIEDSEKLFKFEAIGLEKLDNTEIVIDDNAKYLKCSKEEYNTLKKRMQENFTVFYRAGNALYHSYRKTGIEYNPIERE